MNYTLEQYQQMSIKFNKMTFRQKLETLIKNKNILTLAADGNWWGVKVKNKDIQNQLEDLDCNFYIENEWSLNKIFTLVELLGLEITDI